MPKIKASCHDCGKRITTRHFESGMVVHSSHTGRRWCPACVLKMIRA